MHDGDLTPGGIARSRHGHRWFLFSGGVLEVGASTLGTWFHRTMKKTTCCDPVSIACKHPKTTQDIYDLL